MRIYTATLSLIFFLCVVAGRAVAQSITAGSATGSISACAGTASAAPSIRQFTVSGSGLTAAITVTAPANFEVSANAASGYTNSFSIPQSGGTANGNVYIRSAASASAGGISGNVSLSSAGVSTILVPVTGNVTPLPVIDAVGDQVVAAGAFTPGVNFTGTSQDQVWTNDRPDIGLPAMGAGNIPIFKAVNNGTTAITATITVTPKPGSLAYVANAGENFISVINTATNSVTNVTVGNGPTKTIVSPDGTRVYIANYTDGTISTLDATTNTELSKVTVKKYLADVELSPDGSSLYVVSTGGNVATVINTATNATKEFKIDPNPVVMIRSPDGSRVYSANFGPPGTITVINTATNAVQATIPNINSTDDLAITPNGGKLYATESFKNRVNVINTATNTLLTTVTVGSYPTAMAMHPNGSKVYVSNQTSNDVSVVNTATDRVEATIAVGNYPQGISISADGSRLYTVGFNSQTVSVINTATNTVIATIPMSGNLGRPALSPDGTRLLVPELIGGTVYIVNTVTNTVVGNVAVGKNPTLYNNSVSSGLGCVGTPVSFTITVNPPPPPIINHTGSPAALTTVYGTASSSSNFNVSASRLINGVLVTPPAGFEVSMDDVTFSPTLTLGPGNGTLASTRIYIRLSATADAQNYGGDIVLTSGPTTHNITIPTSTINPAPITIIAGGIGKVYGMALDAQYTGPDRYTMTGILKNGNTITDVTLHYGTGAAATDAVANYTGSVTIGVISGSNGFIASNYDITRRPGTINIAPAELTLTAYDELGKPYGTTLVTGPGKISFLPIGLRNGETIGSVTLTYGPGASAGDRVQLYTGSVVASAPVGGTFNINNYTLKTPTTPGNIEVVPALLSVTADDKSKNFGQPNPAFTYAITGFVNNETEAVLTGKPSLTSPANTNSQWGTFPIIPAGATADNYAFVYNNGTLTIIPPITLPGAVLKVSNAFTPNGDGINDTWNIPALASYPNCTVKIFDRRGTLLFNSIGYPKPWDGTYQGTYLPAGVYYYLIDPKQEAKVISGSITIIR